MALRAGMGPSLYHQPGRGGSLVTPPRFRCLKRGFVPDLYYQRGLLNPYSLSMIRETVKPPDIQITKATGERDTLRP